MDRFCDDFAYGAVFNADMTPRSLYVSRKVVNVSEIKAWARTQGITIPADQELHVTLIHDENPIDWAKVEADWTNSEDGRLRIPPGGARSLEMFGKDSDSKVAVLEFVSRALGYRREEFLAAGASADFAEYRPHITLGPGPIPPTATPYQGAIVLGPEIFEEVLDKE